MGFVCYRIFHLRFVVFVAHPRSGIETFPNVRQDVWMVITYTHSYSYHTIPAWLSAGDTCSSKGKRYNVTPIISNGGFIRTINVYFLLSKQATLSQFVTSWILLLYPRRSLWSLYRFQLLVAHSQCTCYFHPLSSKASHLPILISNTNTIVIVTKWFLFNL